MRNFLSLIFPFFSLVSSFFSRFFSTLPEVYALSKKEFLMNMKALINDEKQWDYVVKDAVVDAFDTIDTADDGSIGIVELCRWLEVGRSGIASRRSSVRRPP